MKLLFLTLNLFCLNAYSGNLSSLLSGGTGSSVTFVGLTSATYSGNLNGIMGANQKCQAQYPDSFFCTESDILRSKLANTTDVFWVHVPEFEPKANCYRWTASSGQGRTINLGNGISSCTPQRPLACCQ